MTTSKPSKFMMGFMAASFLIAGMTADIPQAQAQASSTEIGAAIAWTAAITHRFNGDSQGKEAPANSQSRQYWNSWADSLRACQRAHGVEPGNLALNRDQAKAIDQCANDSATAAVEAEYAPAYTIIYSLIAGTALLIGASELHERYSAKKNGPHLS